jgi:hypothetical protein
MGGLRSRGGNMEGSGKPGKLEYWEKKSAMFIMSLDYGIEDLRNLIRSYICVS